MSQALPFRSHIKHHHILVSRQLCDDLVDDLRSEHLHNLTCQLILQLRVHKGSIVEEVVNHRVHELAVLAALGSLGRSLIAGENVLLCPLNLIVAKSVTPHPLYLCKQGLKRFAALVFLAVHRCHHHFGCLTDGPYAEAGGKERSIARCGNIVQPLIHHIADHVLQDVFKHCNLSVFEFPRSRLALPINRI